MQLACSRPLNPEEVRDCAAEIAANNMRKLLPPVQRARLAELRLTEALDLGAGALRKSLEAVKIKMNQAPTKESSISLAKLLLVHEPGSGGSMAAQWLEGTPRQVLDLTETFARIRTDGHRINKGKEDGRRINKNERDDQLIVTIFEEIRRQIREDWRVPFELRQRLDDMLATTPRLSFDLASVVRFEQEYHERVPLQELDDCILYLSAPAAIRVFVPAEQTLRERTPFDALEQMPVRKVGRYELPETNQVRLELHTRLAGGILFAHDLMSCGGYMRHSPLTYNGTFGPRVTFGWVNTATGGDPLIEWPKPEWWTFRDFERFAEHWCAHVDRPQRHYGFAWLAAMLEVVMNEPCRPGPDGIAKERVADLVGGIVDERPWHAARRLLRRSVIESVALLLAPEYMSGVRIEDVGDSMLCFLQTDAEIQARIRLARAKLVSVLERPTPVRQGEVRPALLPMIAPARAMEQELNFNRQSVLKLLDSTALPHSLRAILLTGEVTDLLALREASKEYKNLPEIRNALLAARDGEIDDELKDEIDRLVGSLSWMGHPFNSLAGGALVPTQLDIIESSK